MKKILALLLTFVLVFAFTACGEQTTDNESSDGGVTEITLAEGLPTFILENPKYEQEIPEGSAETCTHYYTSDKDGKNRFCKIFVIENPELSIEEYTEAEAAELGGCWSTAEFEGVECTTYCASYERDGDWYYDRTWMFEKDNNFYEISFYFPTVEVEIGETGVYMWMPAGYEKADTNGDNEYLLAAYDDSHKVGKSNLPSFAHFDIIDLAYLNNSYEEEFEYYSNQGDEVGFTKEQYEAWQADGWTLDEVKEYYTALKNITEEKNYSKDEKGIDVWVFEDISKNQDGVNINTVRVIVPVDGKYYGLKIYSPEADWTSQGSAMANTIHVK